MKIKLKMPDMFKSRKRLEAERKEEAVEASIELMKELEKLYRE